MKRPELYIIALFIMLAAGCAEYKESSDGVAVLNDEVVIDAPVSEVWTVLSHHEGYVDWAGVDEMEMLSEERELGAKRKATIGPMVLHQTIDEFEPDNTFSYTVSDVGPFEVAGSRWTLHPEEGRTRVKLASSFRLKMGLPAFVFAWRVRDGQTTALEGLKAHLDEKS